MNRSLTTVRKAVISRRVPAGGPLRAGVEGRAALRPQIGIALVDLRAPADDGRRIPRQHQSFCRNEAAPEGKVRAQVLQNLVLDAEARIEDAEVAFGWREVRLERRLDGLGGDVIEAPAESNDRASAPELQGILGVGSGGALVAVGRERRRAIARSRVRTAHARHFLVVESDDEAVGARPPPHVLDLRAAPAQIALEAQIRQERPIERVRGRDVERVAAVVSVIRRRRNRVRADASRDAKVLTRSLEVFPAL